MGLVWLLCGIALQAAGDGGVTGTVADQSGARLPGVGVQVVASAGRTRPGVDDHRRRRRLSHRAPARRRVLGRVRARRASARTRQRIAVVGGATQAVTATLGVDGLSEASSVSARDVRLDVDRPTLSVSFSNEMLADVPSPSRNYTHVIVAEAGVSAPLPDRTGRNLNLATEPGAQAEDGSQTLNPSVNGARPTNNSLRVNGIDTTNMLSASGGLGGSLGVPLEALEEIEVQTALTSAAQGRNGGGSIEIVTRQGTNRFNGHRALRVPARADERQRVLPQSRRHRQARVPPQRRQRRARRSDPARAARSSSSPAQSTRFRSGYASNATAATGLPVGLGDVRTPETIAGVANDYLRNGAADNPAFAANFLRALRAFPADQQAGPHRHVLQRREHADLPRADGRPTSIRSRSTS